MTGLRAGHPSFLGRVGASVQVVSRPAADSVPPATRPVRL